MLTQGQVAPGTYAAGANPYLRQLADGTVCVADGHSKFQEAVYRGNCYAVADTGFHTMPAGLSASPINVSLYNPINSGVNGVIWFANMVEGVAWPAAAIVWLAFYNVPAAAPTTGTALAPTNCNGGSNKGKITPLTTATIAAAPLAALILGVGLTGAITVATQGIVCGGFLDGAFFVAPGCTAVIASSTVSGTTGAAVSWIYEEVPVSFG